MPEKNLIHNAARPIPWKDKKHKTNHAMADSLIPGSDPNRAPRDQWGSLIKDMKGKDKDQQGASLVTNPFSIQKRLALGNGWDTSESTLSETKPYSKTNYSEPKERTST